MAMNKWECQGPDCTNSIVGVGGAMGLRAIGWYVVTGPVIFCPVCRPDPMPCVQTKERAGTSCTFCRGEQEAYSFQEAIRSMLGLEPGPMPLRDL